MTSDIPGHILLFRAINKPHSWTPARRAGPSNVWWSITIVVEVEHGKVDSGKENCCGNSPQHNTSTKLEVWTRCLGAPERGICPQGTVNWQYEDAWADVRIKENIQLSPSHSTGWWTLGDSAHHKWKIGGAKRSGVLGRPVTPPIFITICVVFAQGIY